MGGFIVGKVLEKMWMAKNENLRLTFFMDWTDAAEYQQGGMNIMQWEANLRTIGGV